MAPPSIPDDLPLVARAAPSEPRPGMRQQDRPRAAPAGLGLDSLELLETIADLDRRFALSRTGVEDHLVLRPSLGAWGELLAEHLRLCGPDLPITFTTSGSQGTPRHVSHSAAALLAEADALLSVLTGSGASCGARCGAGCGAGCWGRGDPACAPAGAGLTGRVVVLVPCHHIFGFLVGALVPARAGWPVMDLCGRPPGALARSVRPGDLIVATPYLLSLALEAGERLPEGLSAVVSGAAAPGPLWAACARAGITLTEIYGATETGGVGWRRAPGGPFRLLPHLCRDGQGVTGPSGAPLALQDRIAWQGARTLAVLGRVDRMVQVGGVNVSPDAVARHLAALEGVAEAAVRLDAATGRLKAFVVPRELDACAAPGRLDARLRAECATLPAPARPHRFDFGAALPRGPSGKPADW